MERKSGRARTELRKFEANSYSIQRKFARLWTALPLLQPRHPKSDRLLDADAEIEKSWAKEIERRVQALDSGIVKSIPASEVFAEIRNRLK